MKLNKGVDFVLSRPLIFGTVQIAIGTGTEKLFNSTVESITGVELTIPGTETALYKTGQYTLVIIADSALVETIPLEVVDPFDISREQVLKQELKELDQLIASKRCAGGDVQSMTMLNKSITYKSDAELRQHRQDIIRELSAIRNRRSSTGFNGRIKLTF
jgi:hypothetical protein